MRVLLAVLGIAMMLAGLVFNVWVVAAWFTPDGIIDSAGARAAIWVLDVLAVAGGWLVVVHRERLRRRLPACAAAGVLAVLAAEVGLRLVGHGPWQPVDESIRVEPGGRFFQADPVLGYRHLPGAFRITLGGSYAFTATHGDDTLRATGPEAGRAEAGGEARGAEAELWVFGGSITYGWSVSDEETWPWLLQARLPSHRVRNFAVNGYGTLHSLRQFEAAAAPGRPRVAVLAYASIHDERNTFVRRRRKAMAPYNRMGPLLQPFARLRGDGGLDFAMAEVLYEEAPLIRVSALANLLEEAVNHVDAKLHHSHEVSRRLILELARRAQQHDTLLVVAGILDDGVTRDMLAFCGREGIPAVDISYDSRDLGWLNLPHDRHPNAKAHARYASRLADYLQGIGVR